MVSWLKHIFRFREQASPDEVKPFLDHLEDLRQMLFKMAAVIVCGMLVCAFFRHSITNFVQAPLIKVAPDVKLWDPGMMSSFLISLRIAFYSSLILTFPMLVLFLAQFVLPALTLRERKMLYPALGAGFLLFLVGVAFAYYYILPQTLRWAIGDFAKMKWEYKPTITEYFSMATNVCLIFGLAFEMPLVILALAALDLISYELMRSTRVFGYTIVLILAMIIAPSPDPVTFLSLGFPMLLLYEACILVVRFMEKRRAKKAGSPPIIEI